MIKETKPLSMAEASEYITKKESEVDVAAFIKRFTKLKAKEAKELRKNIEGLDFIKVNEKHISKIIDILPETKEDLNKIFIDVGLDEDETNKLLNEIKEFK
jgi:DNA-directed RNA polymerase subunit F